MKRDARIGLAVVLVLGLMVTLLIGRTLCKPEAELAEADVPAGGPADYSQDITRVDGVDPATVSAAAAAAPAQPPVITIPSEPVAAPMPEPETPNPALQRFVDDNTRRISAAPVVIEPQPAITGGNNTRPVEPPKPQPTRDDHAFLDHEQLIPLAPASSSVQPSDGYGYTITPGDNIWKISTKVYGDGKYTQKILEANPDLKANKLKAGVVIRIPIIPQKTVLMKLPSFADASKPAAAARGPVPAANARPATTDANAGETAAASEATKHKIQPGETLGAIAHKYYGFSGPKSVGRIVSANPGLDSSKLKVGQEIVVPAAK